jgi:hypothetical protein
MNGKPWTPADTATLDGAHACAAELDANPVMQRAAFLFRLYRVNLYRRTDKHDLLEDRLVAAQNKAQDVADAAMKRHGVKRLMFGLMKCGDALRYAPSWRHSQPDKFDIRRIRARRRARWWEDRDPAKAEHWEAVATAVSLHRYRKSPWPLRPIDMKRARAHLAAENNEREQNRIRAEIEEDQRLRDEARAKEKRARDIKEKAHEMLGEIIPGAQAQKRMRKAQAFDALVTLLQEAKVDAKTKAAIAGLRRAVEEERRSSRGVPKKPVHTTRDSKGTRHSQGGSGSISAATG